MYRVMISVQIADMEEWSKVNEVCRAIESESGGGTGFSCRDLDYDCKTEEEAKDLHDRLKKAVEEAGLTIECLDYFKEE